jgi:putative spermidine/putrescine transport system permease protein
MSEAAAPRHRRLPRDSRLWLAGPAILLVGAVFILPVGLLLLRSFSDPRWGLQNYAAAFAQPVYLRVFWNTVVIASSVTVLCLIIGYPVAYTMAHAGERGRRFLVFVVLIPFWTSLLVRTYAWLVLLQQNGLINRVLVGSGLLAEPAPLVYNRLGVLLGMVQVQLPFMVLPLYAVLSRIHPRYGQAAATLGAPPTAEFRRVYLPLSLPGIFTGCTLVFITSLGYYITPALLGGRQDLMIAQLVLIEVGDFGNWGLAGALAIILLFGATVTLALFYRVVAARRRPLQ